MANKCDWLIEKITQSITPTQTVDDPAMLIVCLNFKLLCGKKQAIWDASSAAMRLRSDELCWSVLCLMYSTRAKPGPSAGLPSVLFTALSALGRRRHLCARQRANVFTKWRNCMHYANERRHGDIMRYRLAAYGRRSQRRLLRLRLVVGGKCRTAVVVSGITLSFAALCFVWSKFFTDFLWLFLVDKVTKLAHTDST